MGYRRYNVSSTSGSFSGATTTAGYGPALFIGENTRQVQDLSAYVSLTGTITGATMGLKWQGSNDAATWVDVANGPANTAATVLITGTGTAANVAKSVEAPVGVYGYKYARSGVVWTSATAGGATDVYAMGYIYRQRDPGEVLF
ncbi:MAG: hypothetical protein WC551_07625 [Patescibacteria group bacterium]